ncbi:MAG: molybdopterin-containing oxidoreductase family protein [Candidatus Helarchaeota archaeon]
MNAIKQEKSVFKKFTCPTCNAGCGLLIEVMNNKVISVRPDKNNPLSNGFCCPKGISLGDITNDKDRVLRPLKRVGADFQKISWKQALHEIADKLSKIRTNYGPNSIAYYMGTNSLHQYAHGMFVTGFMDAIGSRMSYNAGSVDNNNKFVTQYFLYGNSAIMTIPDLPNTDLLIIIGSNPVVTRLSLVNCPNVTRILKGIKKRGGEIYIIDPRRNETVKIFANDDEHYIPIFPNTDIFLLLSMINLIFEENLKDKNFLKNNTKGYEKLEAAVKSFTPELAESICKVPAEKIMQLARKFVKTKRAVIYARLGTCLSTFGTINAWAIEVLNIISGKLDRPGGAIFGKNVINISKLGRLLGMGSYNKYKSRVGKYPEVMGAFPLGTLAREILSYKNPVKALFVSGGNPYLSAPNTNEFEKALKKLELCVLIDFYINETAYIAADYILPARTPLENSNISVFELNYQIYPHLEYVNAVIEPDKYGPKPEWEILLSLIKLMKLKAFGNGILDLLPKLFNLINKEFHPDFLIRIFLFLGQVLDKRFPYLSNGALTFKALKKKKLILLGPNEYGVLRKHIQTPDKKINLMNSKIEEEIKRCKKYMEERFGELTTEQSKNEFLVIGRRNLKTMNSWMHNVERLWRKKQVPKLLINPNDADRLELNPNDSVILKNELGSIKVPIEITNDIIPGVICYPHGWGHKNPKLKFANEHAGENINILTSSKSLEKLSGMPLFNGFKVKLFKSENDI